MGFKEFFSIKCCDIQSKISKEIDTMNNNINFNNQIQDNYRIPKVLIEDEKYKDLNSSAIVLYSILLDETMEKSKELGWIDDAGSLYVIFASQRMTDILNIGNAKLSKIKKQLIEYDLIEINRGGIGEYDKIYVKKIV